MMTTRMTASPDRRKKVTAMESLQTDKPTRQWREENVKPKMGWVFELFFVSVCVCADNEGTQELDLQSVRAKVVQCLIKVLDRRKERERGVSKHVTFP